MRIDTVSEWRYNIHSDTVSEYYKVVILMKKSIDAKLTGPITQKSDLCCLSSRTISTCGQAVLSESV